MRFDPTPQAVSLLRVNAFGMGAAIIAAAIAMFLFLPTNSTATFVVTLIGMAVFVLSMGAMYVLPAFVPRRLWGYAVAWVQIVLGLTSGTATLPTIPVLIAFTRPDVRDWFDGTPITQHAEPPRRFRAMKHGIIGYWAIICLLPFVGLLAVKSMTRESKSSAERDMLDAVRAGNGTLIVQRDTAQMAPLRHNEFAAQTLTTSEPWSVAQANGPVAVTVWASYCSSCSTQLSKLSGTTMLGTKTKHVTLALDCETARPTVRQRLADAGTSSPALCATQPTDIQTLPTTVLIDAKGRERARLLGVQDVATLTEFALAIESER